ncbi:DLA class II histocompatibility antigen, DR-1 beta chain-like isoform X2 [Chlorocebus sabaeus]|uniref:DLA class II histocompatibility antigen, DR-1 beta chain-like isoform X2 n=1 Tax=Chlorocebus sabaeus TaxID=60711 RepID=UPI003BF97A39
MIRGSRKCLLGGGSQKEEVQVAVMRQVILVQSLAKRRPAQLGNGERIPNAHFWEQIKQECYFSNGTERMRFVQRFTHSPRSMRASTATWESSGRWWSWSRGESRNGISQKNLLGYLWGLLDTYCRHNYEVFESFSMQRREEID